jgi:multidrug efflux pump subunit AcrA (membrane-fusion protein)
MRGSIINPMIPTVGAAGQARRRRRAGYGLVAAGLLLLAFWALRTSHRTRETSRPQAPKVATAERRPFVRALRLHGVTASTQAQLVLAPRLNSPDMGTLRIVTIAAAGSRVRQGDALVEFDRQAQQRNVLDRRAEAEDALQQIRRREADEAVERAADQSALRRAETAAQIAKLDLRRNEALSRIDAERNEQNAEEAAARLLQVRRTQEQRRLIAAAERRTLQSRAEAARAHLRYAEDDLSRLTLLAPMDGLVLLVPVWREGLRELGAGDETHPGEMFMKIVDPAALEIRAAVDQADVRLLAPGQRAESRLDAYPDLRLPGRVLEIGPIATGGGRRRTFEVRIAAEAKDSRLLPDLTAAIDVELERLPEAIVIPRDAVVTREGRSFVRLPGLLGTTERAIRVRATGDCEVAVGSGLAPGERVLRTQDDL